MDKHVDISRLSDQLRSIGERAEELESKYAKDLESVHPQFGGGARNLVHYLALRESDISELQQGLTALGLSSLGHAERNVMGSVHAVHATLQKLLRRDSVEADNPGGSLDLRNPTAEAHKRAILGAHPAGREVAIMVTLPTEAGDNLALVSEMIAAGMDIARINCAHDDLPTWEAMVRNVRHAGAPCRIIMDLSGPKIRTGELRPGPRVVHVRPRRDPLGRVIAPRRIRFMPDDMLQRGTKAALFPVPRECIEHAEEGDEIRLKDTRGKQRYLKVVQKDDKGLVLESHKGAYIATGTKLRLLRRASDEKLSYRVGELPAIEQPLLLHIGDTLNLHRSSAPGTPAKEDVAGNIAAAAHIGCQQPEVFEFVSAGDPVLLNDGKIAGIVQTVASDHLQVEITRAKPTGSKLRGDRGINFPDSDIRLPGLTATDRENLQFVVNHADAVCLSFVRKPKDIRLLQEELRKYPNRNPGLVIKIETERAFRNLPKLLLTTMRSYPAAVMIARGDLAVECGWERLAELQEEIIWFCEAAQMPVMWATQVLEQEAKKGQPSRAEISDAAMSQQADCVMLNKGPHILGAIRMLDNILRRMEKHRFKKTARMHAVDFPGDKT